MRKRVLAAMTAGAVVCGLSVLPAVADEAARSATLTALESGKLADGSIVLEALVAKGSDVDEARYGLGMIQFVQAVEHLSQGLYRYGLQPPRSVMMPIVRLPVPLNPNPEPIDYEKFRAILLAFVADLDTSEKTLGGMSTAEVKIPVDLMAVRYDADGDGTVGPEERLADVLARILDIDVEELGQGPLVIAFDRADALWMRGYSHVLQALGEFLLGYDWHESFDASFHIFFPKAHSPFQNALAPPGEGFFSSEVAIADLISFLHIRWPVAEPARLAAARQHLKSMVSLSRENWVAIKAETDDDREWIPNPDQKSVVGTPVSAGQIEAWHKVLDEVDLLLDGKKLMPHWRMMKGINVKRAFDEPQPFDIVLWITGPAALPYLEDGPILTSEEWSAITDAFEGSFGSYAIWFN